MRISQWLILVVALTVTAGCGEVPPTTSTSLVPPIAPSFVDGGTCDRMICDEPDPGGGLPPEIEDTFYNMEGSSDEIVASGEGDPSSAQTAEGTVCSPSLLLRSESATLFPPGESPLRNL